MAPLVPAPRLMTLLAPGPARPNHHESQQPAWRLPPAGALRLRDGGRPLAWLVPGAVVRPVSRADLPGRLKRQKSAPLDPSRPARLIGRRDDGDGMGQAATPARGARLTLPSAVTPAPWARSPCAPNDAIGCATARPMAPSGGLRRRGQAKDAQPPRHTRPEGLDARGRYRARWRQRAHHAVPFGANRVPRPTRPADNSKMVLPPPHPTNAARAAPHQRHPRRTPPSSDNSKRRQPPSRSATRVAIRLAGARRSGSGRGPPRHRRPPTGSAPPPARPRRRPRAAPTAVPPPGRSPAPSSRAALAPPR